MSDSHENPTAHSSLAETLAQHNILLAPEQIAALDRYCQRLWDWNTRLNLTRHTTYEKFVSRDVVDSQQLANLLAPGERVLDVGTGGGVPGIVIAILRPDVKVWLCDSVAKKAHAVAAIAQEAQIPVEVRHARAEELLASQKFDTLVVRAVAPLAKLLVWFKPCWPQFRRLLVIKGPQWVAERYEARQKNLFVGLALRKTASYPLAGTSSESVVLEITANSDAPAKPRGPGKRRK